MNSILLNFGCGGNLLPPPWRNLDLDRPDEADRIDITKSLPFADGSVDFILAEHVCEHVPAPDCFRFFEECHRILKPEGALRVCVPMLDRITDRAHARDLIVGHGHCVVFNPGVLAVMLKTAGFFSTCVSGLRENMDGHWKQIGRQKDALETLRMEARK